MKKIIVGTLLALTVLSVMTLNGGNGNGNGNSNVVDGDNSLLFNDYSRNYPSCPSGGTGKLGV